MDHQHILPCFHRSVSHAPKEQLIHVMGSGIMYPYSIPPMHRCSFMMHDHFTEEDTSGICSVQESALGRAHA